MRKVATVTAAALTLVAGATAQSSNVVITRAEAQGTHPFVAWTLAPGWCSNVANVAKSPETGSDGSFFAENVIDGGVLDENQTSWLSSSPSVENPGTYYVRVQAHACDFSAGPDWSATATIVKAPPPPPPPPPHPPPPPPPPTPPPTPKGVLVVRGWNGYLNTTPPLSKVSLGQRITVELKGTTRSDRFAMREDGLFCTLTKRGNSCRAYGNAALTYIATRVSANMVVRGKVRFSALYDNPVTHQKATVSTKTLKVVPKKK